MPSCVDLFSDVCVGLVVLSNGKEQGGERTKCGGCSNMIESLILKVPTDHEMIRTFFFSLCLVSCKIVVRAKYCYSLYLQQ